MCPFDGTPIDPVVVSVSLWSNEKTDKHKAELGTAALAEPTGRQALCPGQKLGGYVIGGLLGVGGMRSTPASSR